MPTAVTINGEVRTFDMDADTPLLWLLRDVHYEPSEASLTISGTSRICFG
jgi:aerobic-type carbon monoxide dehydrogenase small subunit (CoxS/CutS family)